MPPARPTYTFDVEGHTVVVGEPKRKRTTWCENTYCPDCPDCYTCPESSK
jgi:hypothetical protein